MTAPVSVGLCRDEAHRYYWNGDGPLVSITTAMRAVDKSGPLVGWAKRLTAEVAVRNIDVLPRLISEGGPQSAIDYLKRIADHKREKAADMGTRVHKLAEAIARKQPVEIAEDEQPYLNAYLAWESEWRPRYVAAEYLVCSLTHGYAGTGDLVVETRCRVCIGNPLHRWRLDTKTSEVGPAGYKGPYAETALQLAAANYAEFSGRPGDPRKYRVPAADHHGVLALRGDGTYAVVPYDVTPDTFEAFLAAKRVWDWLQGPAKSVVGSALQIMEAVA